MDSREPLVYYGPGGMNPDGKIETPHVIGKVFFEIRCAICNTGLCKQITVKKVGKRKQNMIQVFPCPKCLKAIQNNEPVKALALDSEGQGAWG